LDPVTGTAEKENADTLKKVEPDKADILSLSASFKEEVVSNPPFKEEDVVSNAESFDTKVLQTQSSRMVESSLANQIVAECLNISPDDASHTGDIVAAKVPTVADIPRPSIISESDVSRLNGSVVGGPGEEVIEEDGSIEELDMGPKTSTPSKDIYALVETSVKFKMKASPVEADQPAEAMSVSPIYSQVVKTVPRPEDEHDPDPLLDYPPDLMPQPSLALTQEETRDVLDFINNRISSRSQLNVDSGHPVSCLKTLKCPTQCR
jgi:hypothetical protein